MADADRTLEVFLKLTADTAAATAEMKAALKEVETAAVTTKEAVSGAGTSTASGVDYAAVDNSRQQASEALNAAQAKGVITAEQKALAEQAIDVQMARQLALALQLQAAQATLSGDDKLAAQLEREAEIRLRSVGIQRTLNVTSAEAIALSEKLVLAQEASAVASGHGAMNLGKAKQEAVVLAREIAAGNMQASTMSSLLGSLGSTLTIAGLAGYELYHVISSQVEETKKLREEFEKIVTELNNASKEWDKFARNAESFTDNVHLAEKIQSELDKMAAEMATFRATQLPLWQRFWDDIITHNDNAFNVNGVLGKPNAGGPGPFQAAKDKAMRDEQNRELDAANEKLDKVNQSTEHWSELLANPKQAWGEITGKLTQAEGQLATLNDARHAPGGTPEQRSAAIRGYTDQLGVVEDLRKKQDEIGSELDKNNKKTKAGGSAHKEVTATLRDQANLLADIRGKQQAITQNPFMSADQKQAALIPLITQEMRALGEQITRDANEQKRLTDPAQWTQMQGKIQQAQREYKKLNIELKKSAFGGSLRADLTAWVNQFGTTAKQVAGIITNTMNTAISSTSQALTGLIFNTGNWKQAFADAAKAIVQNIIQIALQWVVSQTLMKLLSKIFATEQVTTSSTAGSQTAAAWASAATAASIATEGEADIAGVTALSAAMIAGKGIVTGVSAFQSGGYTGFGQDSQFAGFVHKNEYVMPANTVNAYGVGFMDTIRTSVSRPGYAKGGFVGSAQSRSSGGGGGTPQVHIAVFDDPKKLGKWLEGRDGQRIIYDSVSRQRVELGLPS